MLPGNYMWDLIFKVDDCPKTRSGCRRAMTFLREVFSSWHGVFKSRALLLTAEQLQQLFQASQQDVRVPFALEDDGVSRVGEAAVHAAVRELLANALIHADYHGRRGIVIEKLRDVITYQNPGSFRANKSEAISGGVSDARNKLIFNIFALVDIGERSGTGLSNLFVLWDRLKLRRPQIVEFYDPDRVSVKLSFSQGDGADLPQNCPKTAPRSAC